MESIPTHLGKFDWYAPHLAWLRSIGAIVAHDPGESAAERADLRGAVLRDADLSGANLSLANFNTADLRGANLSGSDINTADLRETDLRGANLSGVHIRVANLSDADLRGVRLRGADLRDADLSGANLSETDLSDADLRRVRLRVANLSDADLRGVRLRGADLSGANLSGANLSAAPVIPDIDRVIFEAVSRKGCELRMATWHTCETSHCRAGWAVVLAGAEGEALERKIGTNAAAALIYARSRPDEPVPNWYATDEEVMAELKAASTTG
jgi:uncharacterized protein YjbI with pentapeptide repeats